MFTSDLTAINVTMTVVCERAETSTAVFSDLRSALEAIVQYTSNNWLVKSNQLKLLELLMNGYYVQLCWIPAHGNKHADLAAKGAYCAHLI